VSCKQHVHQRGVAASDVEPDSLPSKHERHVHLLLSPTIFRTCLVETMNAKERESMRTLELCVSHIAQEPWRSHLQRPFLH
jgi:hypothetical protein